MRLHSERNDDKQNIQGSRGEYAGQLKTKQNINNNFLYLPLAVFIALMLVGPSEYLKQINQIEHNWLRIPTGRRQTRRLFTSMVGDLNLGLP